jgi:hypothetical protein
MAHSCNNTLALACNLQGISYFGTCSARRNLRPRANDVGLWSHQLRICVSIVCQMTQQTQILVTNSPDSGKLCEIKTGSKKIDTYRISHIKSIAKCYIGSENIQEVRCILFMLEQSLPVSF